VGIIIAEPSFSNASWREECRLCLWRDTTAQNQGGQEYGGYEPVPGSERNSRTFAQPTRRPRI